MFLKKYWKSNVLFVLFIFCFTFLDVYGDNYWLSVNSVLKKDLFGSHFFVYKFIYLIFTFL